jgi:hypothetical protein
VGPFTVALDEVERVPLSSGLAELTWKSSVRPPAGGEPPFSLAVGMRIPDTTVTSDWTPAVPSGASAVLRS